MKKFYSLKTLPISNNYMFTRLIQLHPEYAIELVKMLTGIEDIDEVTLVKDEWTMNPNFDAKSIRLDAFVKSKNHHIDIEMQTTRDPAIFYRASYYNDVIDIESLSKGQDYRDLPNVIIIFICLFDPLPPNNGVVYKETNRIYSDGKDVTENSFYHNRCVRIYLNTKGRINRDIHSEKLITFIEYLNTGKVTDDFTKRLEESVNEIRNSRKEQERYMTLQYEMDRYVDDRKDEWKAEGKAEGKKDLILSMFQNGIAMEQISKIANISIERVKEILSIQK